ncbi:MAG TPA: ferrochelatase [Terriglobales bacterium]
MTQSKPAIILLAHGSPESPADVPEFINLITGGRPVPDAVIEEVRRRYALVGKSPLTEIALAQGAALEKETGHRVYVGMRNWKPFIAEAVRQMVMDGIRSVLAICLAPQNSSTSVGLYRKALMAGMLPDISVQFVESWHDHPLLVRAFAEKLEPAWRAASNHVGTQVPVIFTAHSVPTRTNYAGDPYEGQVKDTALLVEENTPGLSSELCHFAFQSQGMSGGPWLGPTVESVILELKKQGHRGVVLAPIGFVCDHVEVLYDVDIVFRNFAAEQGMQFWRTESLNVSSTFIAALAALSAERLAAAGPAA